MNGADLITSIINNFTQIFSQYFSQCLIWGKWLFNCFSIISIVWLCLWQAFDSSDVVSAMASFLKKFFMISFFYTLMLNAVPWLSSIVDSAQSMGMQLSHHLVDPASLIQQGITIANKILDSFKNSGLYDIQLAVFIIFGSYAAVLFAFIAIALNLAVTYLLTTFLIAFSGLILAFGVFSFSREIATRLLAIIISHSFKLLSLYLVVDAGSFVFTKTAEFISIDKINSFDGYIWTTSAALIFWIAARIIPNQIVKLFRFKEVKLNE